MALYLSGHLQFRKMCIRDRLGEGLMGILGMLLFIPLTSVCYTLLREQVHKRLGERAASGS